MTLTEIIDALIAIKETRGEIDVLISSRYVHSKIKWIDYSKCRGKVQEHVCIRLNDDEYL